jgi:hypothetical protein
MRQSIAFLLACFVVGVPLMVGSPWPGYSAGRGVVVFKTGTRKMLKLRSIGIRDYSVFEGGQRTAPHRYRGDLLNRLRGPI